MIVVVLLAGLALVAGVTGILALLGRLPGNGYLGVRTPETRRSPEAWRLANAAAGPAFLAAGGALALGALGLGLIGGWIGALVVVGALLGALALFNVAGIAGARAAAAWQATRDDDEPGCCSAGGCGDHAAPAASCDPHSPAGDPADPSADCGVTGGCGSCALKGMCETETSTR